jgi:hypothetical protein
MRRLDDLVRVRVSIMGALLIVLAPQQTAARGAA